MREVVVLHSQQLSPTVRGLTLACADGAPLVYVPGQWVNLEVEVGGKRDKRAYSIATAPTPTAPDRFEIAVTWVDDGLVSRALHALPEGSRLAMDGPHGFFTREGLTQTPALFVGTGTGVCPLRAMLEAELTGGSGPELQLLLGVRDEGSILYRAEFEAMAAANPGRFKFHATLSRAGDGWRGRRGYVQGHLAELLQDRGKPHVYVCGLSSMVNGVRKVLKEDLGYDRRSIHSERYD